MAGENRGLSPVFSTASLGLPYRRMAFYIAKC